MKRQLVGIFFSLVGLGGCVTSGGALNSEGDGGEGAELADAGFGADIGSISEDAGFESLPADEAFARLGDGSLIVKLGGFCRCERTFEVSLRDADDNEVAHYSQKTWSDSAWWPSTVEATTAVVQVSDWQELEETLPIERIPMVAGRCDPRGFANRCGRGATCLTVDRDGQCQPVSVAAWQQTNGALVLGIEGTEDPSLGELSTSVWGEGFHQGTFHEGWAHFPDTSESTVDLFVGPHRVAEGTSVQTPPLRELGESCHSERYLDRCEAGTACATDLTCQPITAPTLSALRAVATEGTVSVAFEGADIERDVTQVEVTFVWATGRRQVFETRLGQSSRFTSSWQAEDPSPEYFGQIKHLDAVGLQGFWVKTSTTTPSQVTLRLVDSEGLESESLTVLLEPSQPEVVSVGEGCDFAGALFTCEPGTFCDRHDTEARAVCQRPQSMCPDTWSVDQIQLGSFEGTFNDPPNLTMGSCSGPYHFAGDQVFEFTAQTTGLHHFDAAGDVNALYVRRHCALPRPGDSELACGHQQRGFDVSVELAVGETVYVFLEVRYGQADYSLHVEGP